MLRIFPDLRTFRLVSWKWRLLSDTKKEHRPKLLSPGIFRWGMGLPREGVGAKKFGMSLEAREIKFLAGYPEILPGYPGGARKV